MMKIPGILFIAMLLAFSAYSQGLSLSQYDVQGCLRIGLGEDVYINSSGQFQGAIRNDAQRGRCLKALAKIDFAKKDLIGANINSGYCRYPQGLQFSASKDEAGKKVTINISYTKPKGICRALSSYDLWMLMPKLPDGYQLSIDIAPKANGNDEILKSETLSRAADEIVENLFIGEKSEYDKLFEKERAAGKAQPATPKKPPVAIPANWKRTLLTGTGLSVASPMPYKLTNDQPDPLNEDIEAQIRWEFEEGGLWSAVSYQKWNMGYKMVRQHLEDTANYIFGNPKAMDQIVLDTTFLGETAAFFDEEYFSQGRKIMLRQKMLVYGKPNDYVMLNFQYPADDKEAAAKASQIIASFKKEGTLAQPQSKSAPANWKLYNFGGLIFEFPSPPAPENCKTSLPEGQTQICADWGKSGTDLSIQVVYTTYPAGSNQPSVAQLSAQDLKFSKEIKANNSDKTEYKEETFPINFGAAAKLTETDAFSTTQTIFIRRDNAFWKVRIYRFNRWNAVRDAAGRVATSIRFKQ